MSAAPVSDQVDVALIGSGVMSAHLGAMLKRLEPGLSIQIFEVTPGLAQESSHGWNNAGTGHAGICELSYTPRMETDGTVDVRKAVEIFEQFEHSKQFWSHAVGSGMIENPRDFINRVPHISFVHGEKAVTFLKARYEAMSAHHFFREMEFTTDRDTISRWTPLLMADRPAGPVAATRMDGGTDVNFGAVARQLVGWLGRQQNCRVARNHRVLGLSKSSQEWKICAKDLATGETRRSRAKFVFVGAGGGSLLLLQKAGLPEAKGLGGFPIGGQWLVCDNPAVVRQHQAKVYGQPLDAAPTMAVPHLDTRILDGKKTLLFGPFAAWTTKFLHQKGHFTDLPRSIRPDNLFTLLNVGVHNLDLVRYLVQQGTQSMADRMKVLHVFYPAAKAEDWRLIDAGIRVQAIKKTDGRAGIVHYGTEVMTSADRSMAALLGASPGASVSAHIVLDVIRQCFPRLLDTPQGTARMKEMISIYGEDIKNPDKADLHGSLGRKAEETLLLH